MKAQRIVQLMATLGEYGAKVGTKWVSTKCPLAPWRHEGGQDHTPSFGVHIKNNGASHYNCFSCGASGELYDLLAEMRMRNKQHPGPKAYQFKEALALVLAEEGESEIPLLPTYDDESAEEQKVFTQFPEDWLSGFVKAPSHPYLVERGVDFETAKALDIRYDSTRNRICFPFRDTYGRLAGMTGRKVDPNDPGPSYFQYAFNKCRNPEIMLGDHWYDPSEPVVLVEGPFDLAKAYRVYENVEATFTASMQVEKLLRVRESPRIITFFDKGTGGDTARKRVDKYLKGKDIYHVIPDTKEEDPGAMTHEKVAAKLKPAFDKTPISMG